MPPAPSPRAPPQAEGDQRKQVIAFLAWLQTKQVKGPFLVVAPRAELDAWMSDIARYLPSTEAVLYEVTLQGRAVSRARARARRPECEATGGGEEG